MLDLFIEDWRDLWKGAGALEGVGAVYTRPEIVELILDLAEYVPSRVRLAAKPILEPSCGDGAFLRTVILRMLESERFFTGRLDWQDPILDDTIRAADISATSVRAARSLVISLLQESGCPDNRARDLADKWVVHTDFLLHTWRRRFAFVIGNPPYVRIEEVPKAVLAHYRRAFATLTDRADLYVAFMECGLRLLDEDGALAFICANRFAKNRYGATLRKLIAHDYRVRHYINLEHTQPFLEEVSAYPAIIVLDRERHEPTRASTLNDIELDTLRSLRSEALGTGSGDTLISHFDTWYPEGEPWITTNRTEHDTLTRLRNACPTLEESSPGTRVGIGVATGADRVFVLGEQHPAIEGDRQIPLMMAADVGNGELRWGGKYLLNPFASTDDGSLVDLRSYPGLETYLHEHASTLLGRHVAKNRPATWYRTIDRIWPSLQQTQKLMIPDIQVGSVIGFDSGQYYPHHNLYWITSDSWPLPALKAILRSTIVRNQVTAHSVQMRGGSVRFQAQTLRRLRIPELRTLPDELLQRLIDASSSTCQREIDALSDEVYSAALY